MFYSFIDCKILFDVGKGWTQEWHIQEFALKSACTYDPMFKLKMGLRVMGIKPRNT